jgi:hypothetical protein
MKQCLEIFSFGLPFFILMSVLYPLTFTASEPPDGQLYMKIDYVKAPPGGGSEYIKIEREIWKPIHNERLRLGIISDRRIYKVIAGEPGSRYDYVITTVFNDFGEIDDYRLDAIISEIYPSDYADGIKRRIDSAREVVRSEIWQIDGSVLPPGATMPGGNYITINFFDARFGSGEHAELELEFWGRIHELRIERNILNSWALYSLLYPVGDAIYYTYSTIDYYDEPGDLTQHVGMELARIAHLNMNDEDLDNYFNRTGEARSLYKTELWRLIDSVDTRSDY